MSQPESVHKPVELPHTDDDAEDENDLDFVVGLDDNDDTELQGLLAGSVTSRQGEPSSIARRRDKASDSASAIPASSAHNESERYCSMGLWRNSLTSVSQPCFPRRTAANCGRDEGLPTTSAYGMLSAAHQNSQEFVGLLVAASWAYS